MYRLLKPHSLRNGIITFTLFVSVIIFCVRGDPRDPYWQVLKKLKACGFNPTQTIDIGANVGSWARDFHTIFPQSKIFMIEGNKKHAKKLKAVGFPFEIALLSSHRKNLTFFQGPGTGTGSTVFRENGDTKMVPVTVSAVSVDEVLAKHEVGTAELLKIDIQGSEVTKSSHTR
jgi:FkbM family methyltransferase